jgi:hypothetical protein
MYPGAHMGYIGCGEARNAGTLQTYIIYKLIPLKLQSSTKLVP